MTAARALAGAHGHGWANVDESLCASAALVAAPTIHGAADVWRRYVAEYVEAYPSHHPGLGPAAEHATATGRTRWAVDVDGRATITISRPSGDVLRAVVTAGGMVRLDVLGEHAARHVDALDVCLRALCVDDGEIARAYRVAGINAASVAGWASDAASLAAQAAGRAALACPEAWVIEGEERARFAAARTAAIAAACSY